MRNYDFTFDLSMKYTQADFDAITDEEFEKTTEVFLYNRKGEKFHFIKPKVGRWIRAEEGELICSICEYPAEFNPLSSDFIETNYCPNCGAKMKRRADGDI